MQLTYIEWMDCFSPTGGPWTDLTDDSMDISERLIIVTVGFVVKENEHYVTLAASCDKAELAEGSFTTDVSGVMHIPVTQIRKRVSIDYARKAAKAREVVWKPQ